MFPDESDFLNRPTSLPRMDRRRTFQIWGPELSETQEPQVFKEQFKDLYQLLSGNCKLRKLIDTATTKAFPQKSLLSPAFNFGVLSVTGILYCLSRMLLLAIGFSSLRQMPKSVYVNTPWTAYIPTLGSST